MKKSDEKLILRSTDGIFSEKQVPQLYVEVQNLRAKLERAVCRQLTFEDALYSWLEEIYRPIMEGIEEYRLEKRVVGDLSLSELYFEIYDEAEKNNFEDISESINGYLKSHRKSFWSFLTKYSA